MSASQGFDDGNRSGFTSVRLPRGKPRAVGTLAVAG